MQLEILLKKTIYLAIFIVCSAFAVSFGYKKLHKEPLVYPVVKVTIPEGWTLAQIDEELFENKVTAEKGIISSFDPEKMSTEHPMLQGKKSLEGFMFPDTYEFFEGSSKEVIIDKFLDNFDAKIGPIIGAKTSPYDILKIGSLIEKETPDAGKDRFLVSGIIYKRLKEGMRLQLDATLCYAKTGRECDKVFPQDKEINSPYNTYRSYGLPPTPISNPGISAIKAATAPEVSEYWYYISDPATKQAIFAKTLDEHGRNIVKYLR